MNIHMIYEEHFKKYIRTYLLLFLTFVLGIIFGTIGVNTLNDLDKIELYNYVNGFFELFDGQNFDKRELLRLSFTKNLKYVLIIWILGVSIIGIPFIYIVIGIRGFTTGFGAGFIIKYFEIKGIIFVIFGILIKDIIIIPCLIALGVNGINFSKSIIRNKSIKKFSKESLKGNFVEYCLYTLIFVTIIFMGGMVEAYVIPFFLKYFPKIN